MKKNLKAKKAKALKKIAKPSKEKSFAFRVEHEETSEEESEDDSSPGTSRKIDSETFNIAISKRNYRRMRTALKLLDFVEGNDDDNESDWSMNSTPSSSVFFDKARIGAKRSTRRLEAMQDLSPKDYFGFCKDCRSRCRSCGRRPSAVAKTKK
uniref:Uncharacterized protein LOC108044059 n=1 Tax=Drosophila rhopaloa TaxID=1041015 RepID=A0A6P4EZD9_DRORH